MGLYCKMTGDFSIQLNGQRVDFFSKSSYKANQLLAILLYHHDEGVSKTTLIDFLYGNDENTDPVNSLKALLFRLRKQLEETNISSDKYVIYKDGVYRFDPTIEFDSDILEFKRYIYQAQNTDNRQEMLSLYSQAINSINGFLLPMFSSEKWVVVEKEKLRKDYEQAVRELVSFYMQSNDFNQAKSLYFRTKSLFPYEDEWELGYLKCLIKEGRLEEAQEEYEKYKKQLLDNKETYPSELIQECYHSIVRKRNFDKLNAEEIIEELKESKPTSAFRCSFAKFADNFHMINRISERSGVECTLILCGIVDEDDKLVKDFCVANKHMDYLESAMLNSLRKSDIITRYGTSQMLVLLWSTSNQKAPTVINRINEAYNFQNHSDMCRVKYLILDNKKVEATLQDR